MELHELDTPVFDLAYWAYYEYESRPMAFISVGELPPQDKIEILCLLDTAYGDTDQETTDYALEFQVWTRMLVHSDRMLVNPKYLIVEEILDALEPYMPADGFARYVDALQKLDQNLINQLHAESGE